MIRKFFTITLAAFLLAAGLLPLRAHAQSSGPSMLCGVQAGASLNVNNIKKCLQTYRQNATTAMSSPTSSTGDSYAALGDSVAAGLGLSGSTSDGCGRSSQGYPNLVANQLGLSLNNLTCSGATAGDLVTQQRTNGANPPAQLNGAFASGTLRLITITAGANDAHWADFIRLCYASNCATKTATATADAYLTGLRAKLYYALYSIYSRSGGNPPRVVITGYYNPVSTNCSGVAPQLTSAELSWITQETTKLNNAIQSVASSYSFVRFAPVSFADHDLCSSDPWVQGPSDPSPFHPTATGQQEIADAVVTATQN